MGFTELVCDEGVGEGLGLGEGLTGVAGGGGGDSCAREGSGV